MTNHEFLCGLYFGDRFCSGQSYDRECGVFIFRMNSISRIIDGDTSWERIAENDIPNASLVFEGVKSVKTQPEYFEINDEVYDVVKTRQVDDSLFEFRISGAHINSNGDCTQVAYYIIACNVSVIDSNGNKRLP